jgi:hypothetical protein
MTEIPGEARDNAGPAARMFSREPARGPDRAGFLQAAVAKMAGVDQVLL